MSAVLRTRVVKVTPREFYRVVHAVADTLRPQLRAQLLRAVQRVKSQVQMERIAEAARRGDVVGVLEAVGLERVMVAELEREVLPALHGAVERTGTAAARLLPRAPGMRGAFDLVNPRVVDFLRAYDFDLVQGLTRRTREGLRQVVLDAFQFGGHPFEQAEYIKELIGLTQRQALAVRNYRRALEAAGQTRAFIRREVQRYAEELLLQRAINIARTETIRAANAGQQALWEQGRDEGWLVPELVRREWIVTPDDKLAVVGPRTTVLTINGWVPIKDIKVGDQVATHRDRFCTVTFVQRKRYTGPAVTIDVGCGGKIGKITLTYHHPVLVHRNGKDLWLPVQDITEEDFVYVSAMRCQDCGRPMPFGPGVSRRGKEKNSICHYCNTKRVNRERWSRPGERDKLRLRNRDRWKDPEARRRMSKLMRRKISVAMRRRYRDPLFYWSVVKRLRRLAQRPGWGFAGWPKEKLRQLQAKARRTLGRNSKGQSWPERKLRWFLERQGIVFKQQWPFQYLYRGAYRTGYADFYLPGSRTVIECDGPFHRWAIWDGGDTKARDRAKERCLRQSGYQVLRFTDTQIKDRFGEVASAIRQLNCIVRHPIKRVTHRMIAHQTVYHLTVDGDKSFIAKGLVVHNCPICESIPAMNPDGVPLDGAFQSVAGEVALPPAHPQCRCTVGLMLVQPAAAP